MKKQNASSSLVKELNKITNINYAQILKHKS